MWKEFQHWARVNQIRFSQGSLGHEWLRPSVIGTNLSLTHLQGLPHIGFPNPSSRAEPTNHSDSWCTGFKKEVIEALEGRVKTPSLEELDRVISEGRSKIAEASECSASSSSNGIEPHAEDPVTAVDDYKDDKQEEAEVNALKPDEREAWRAHIMRGHLPYRRDCQFCVEGAGLGVQHRRIKNPQAFTLSVDLFGPMPSPEKGRDEQSVSGNPHLRFGLVGVYRMPKSMISQRLTDSTKEGMLDVDDPFKELPGAPSEYEPTEPGEPVEPDTLPDLEQPKEWFENHQQSVGTQALATQLDTPSEVEHPGAEALDDSEKREEEYEWIDDEPLEEEIQKLTSKVEMVTLRFFVGLKSKTGADVTAGIQQMIIRITQQFPLRILHCDPGTEFTSDALARWLPGQGVKLQTTIPTDKQGNGLAERVVGWFKARARTLISANSLHVSLWPLAMRWAAESYNRSVLQQEPLPAFGQTVLHKT